MSKKASARACVRKCKKQSNVKEGQAPKADKKKTGRISISKYMVYLDEAILCTIDKVDAAHDDQLYYLGIHEGLSSVKRHMQELAE